MTVSSPVNSVTYTGNNATTIFSYDFEIRVAENAVVILTDITDPDNPIATTLTAAQYTLTGVGDENGGTVTYPIVGSPIDTNTRITIQTIEPFTQEVDLVNQDGFYPSVVEGALDKLTRLCQQLDEQLSRAVLTPVGATQDVDLSSLIDAINTAAAALAGAVSVLTPCTATGTNTIALTPVTGGALGSYINQALFSFVAVNTTNGVVTANISGLGAKKVYLETGVQASTGDIISGVLYLMSYVAALDSANGGFYLFGTGTITLARLPTQAESTVLGVPVGGGTVVPQALTKTQLQAILALNLNRLPRAYLAGLSYGNNSGDATNDLDINTGTARDSTDAIDITLGSGLVKRSDAAWAVGTNQGMLDTGVVGNAWYHLFAIIRPDTGVVDILSSLSPTAPTLPANYTKFRRIGSFLRTGGAIKAFTQIGDWFHWTTPVLDINTATLGAATSTFALTVPTGIFILAYMNLAAGHATVAATRVYIHTPLAASDAPSATVAPLSSIWVAVTTANTTQGPCLIMTNASSTLSAASTQSNTTLLGATLGYVDRRGRDD